MALSTPLKLQFCPIAIELIVNKFMLRIKLVFIWKFRTVWFAKFVKWPIESERLKMDICVFVQIHIDTKALAVVVDKDTYD